MSNSLEFNIFTRLRLSNVCIKHGFQMNFYYTLHNLFDQFSQSQQSQNDTYFNWFSQDQQSDLTPAFIQRRYQESISELTGKYNEQTNAVTILEKKLEFLSKRHSEYIDKLHDKRFKIKALKTELKTKDTELSEARKQLKQVTQLNSDLKVENTYISNELDSLQKRNDSIQQQSSLKSNEDPQQKDQDTGMLNYNELLSIIQITSIEKLIQVPNSTLLKYSNNQYQCNVLFRGIASIYREYIDKDRKQCLEQRTQVDDQQPQSAFKRESNVCLVDNKKQQLQVPLSRGKQKLVKQLNFQFGLASSVVHCTNCSQGNNCNSTSKFFSKFDKLQNKNRIEPLNNLPNKIILENNQMSTNNVSCIQDQNLLKSNEYIQQLRHFEKTQDIKEIDDFQLVTESKKIQSLVPQHIQDQSTICRYYRNWLGRHQSGAFGTKSTLTGP